MLTWSNCGVEVGEGTIDTVVLAFTDMQGRLQGKRLAADYFLDDVVGQHVEGCNYLLAVDVDMNTVPGYAMSSWERGYGDFVLTPDMSTLRRIPWYDSTAMVLADLSWHDGAPVVASPRQILQAQVKRLADRGWQAMVGTELEFILYATSYEEAYRSGTAPSSRPTSTTLTTRSWAPPGSSRCCARSPTGWRVPVSRSSRPRVVQPGPARDRVQVRRGGHDLRRPLHLQDRGQGDRRWRGHEHHVHGQAERARGQLLPYPYLAAGRRRRAGDGGRPAVRPVARREHFIAGQLAALPELALWYAPNINSYKRYALGSFAPTAARWGIDNRTCAMRLVGHESSLRIENRVPGGDVNPYLAVSALIAAGLHGIDHELPLEPAFEGNAYTDTGPGCHRRCATPWTRGRRVELARESFGHEVVEHYANGARVELSAFDAAVTDWELQRGFERL